MDSINVGMQPGQLKFLRCRNTLLCRWWQRPRVWLARVFPFAFSMPAIELVLTFEFEQNGTAYEKQIRTDLKTYHRYSKYPWRLAMQGLVLALAVMIGFMRPFMLTHPVSSGGSYEAIAHLFVGGLIGAWLVSRQRRLLYTVIALSSLEVACAVASKLRLVIIAALMLASVGCAYKPGDVDDFPVICGSCSSGFTRKITTIHCRADSVLSTCCHTGCRHCGQTLAESGDDVSMTALSGAVSVIKRGR